MSNVQVAIIGEDSDAKEILFKGFKMFSPDIVVLIVKEKYIRKGEKIEKSLKELDINSKIFKVGNSLVLEEVFTKIKEIQNIYSKDILVINVDTDYMTSCLALSSAFVNGIAAIGILNEKIITYPIMKFSYYNAINEKKFEILKMIYKHEKIDSMEKLSRFTKMSLPLIAYHLKGNRDSEGLVEMKLVEANKHEGHVVLSLTELGKLIVQGSVDVPCVGKNCKK